jgi:hypothetical protein
MKSFQLLPWEAVKEQYYNQLPDIIDELDFCAPSRDAEVYLARYSYGDYIFHQHRWCYPSFFSKEIPPLKDLSYSALPLGCVLHHGAEQYLSYPQQTSPIKLYTPDKFIGLTEALQSKRSLPQAFTSIPLEITAGARTLFLLPSLDNEAGLHQLQQKYHWPIARAEFAAEQWFLFKEMAKASTSSWTCEVIWFPVAWLDYPPFRDFLYLQQNQSVNHHGLMIDLILNKHLNEMANVSPYLLATLRHLLHIALGSYPGVRPQANSELWAPTALIKELILDTHPLACLPTLLGPSMFEHNHPVYYSCHVPTITTPVPTNSIITSIKFSQQIMAIINRLDCQVIDLPAITGFHSQQDPAGILLSSHRIHLDDKGFVTERSEQPFAFIDNHSKFFSSCFCVGEIGKDKIFRC